MIFDLHSDVLVKVAHLHRKGQRQVLSNQFLPLWKQAQVGLIVCAVYVNDGEVAANNAMRSAFRQIAALHDEVASSKDFALCTTYAEIEGAITNNKISLMLSLEGAEPLEGQIEMLDVFYALGVRFLGLTHSRKNPFAVGASASKKQNINGSLTAKGEKLVAYAQRKGIVIDISHLNDEGVQRVFEITKKPIIASHSNAREICCSFRNLTDRQIKSVADSGGVVGLNGVNIFANNDIKQVSAQDFLYNYRHINQICSTAIGLDIQDGLQDLWGGAEKLLDGQLVTVTDIFPNHLELKQFLSTQNLSSLQYKNMLEFLQQNF